MTLCFLCLLCAACGEKRAQQGNDLYLQTVTHERFYLNQQLGSPGVLIFWATWCTSCKRELLKVQEYMEHIPEESLFAAAVCTDPENQDIVQRLAQNLSLSYPILLDTEKKVAAHYQVRILPTTVVLDPQGRITMIKQGYTQAIWQQVRKALERLL